MAEEPIMTNREILRDMQSKVGELYTEVMGNEKAKRPGYNERIEKLENKEKKDWKIYMFISAISTGIGAGIHAVKSMMGL